MKYEKRHILTTDRNPNGGEDYEAPYPFLVGQTVHSWEDSQSSYGTQYNDLAPAFTADPEIETLGGRCWLHTWDWSPAPGYTASGYGATLLSFEEGVRILIEGGRFHFPLPATDA